MHAYNYNNNFDCCKNWGFFFFLNQKEILHCMLKKWMNKLHI